MNTRGLRKSLSALIIVIILSGICTVTDVSGQTDDNILWSSVRFSKRIDQNWTIRAAPTIRFDNDISKYRNSSVDLAVRRNFGSRWTGQVLTRFWFMPAGDGPRQFLWFQTTYTSQARLKLISRLRYHGDLDTQDIQKADYIRWRNMLLLDGDGSWKPFIAYEPWLRINGIGQIQRERYEAGVQVEFDHWSSFRLTYRRQELRNMIFTSDINTILVTFGVKL